MSPRQLLSKSLLLVAFTAIGLSGMHAATFTWDNAVTISGESDIKTAGTSVSALWYYNAAGSAGGVNFQAGTTTFGAAPVSPTPDGVITTTGFTSTVQGTGVTGTPAGVYQAILGNAATAGAGTATVTFSSLTGGHVYLTQLWMHDQRAPTRNGTATVNAASTNTGSKTVDYNNTNGASGLGQHISGTFTADTASTSFSIQSSNSLLLNGIQLRDVTNVANWTGTANGNWDVATSNNFATNAYNAALTQTNFDSASRLINSVRFADTYWDNGVQTTVTQTTLNLRQPISLVNGTVYFSNSAIDYTMQGTGYLAGATRLVKDGTGRLTIKTANSHTDVTVINAGTLITGDTKALGNGSIYVQANGILQIGDGTVNSVTFGNDCTLFLAAAGATLKINGTESRIILQGAGAFRLTDGFVVDLNNAFDAIGNYTLITGGSGAKTVGTYTIRNLGAGFNGVISNSGGDLVLAVSAVPEPAAYGLLGAGILAAASVVRRRKKAGV